MAAKKVHGEYHLQPEGKDTALFLAAGCREALLLSGSELLHVRRPVSEEGTIAAALSGRGGDDVVLLEGLIAPGSVLVEVLHPDKPGSFKQAPVYLSCVVGDSDPGLGIPFFARDDIEGIAAFLEAHHG